MERTQTLEATADAFQRDVLADQRDEISRFANSGDVVVEDAHGRTLWRGLDAAWEVFRTPTEELDTEPECVAIGHSAHVTHRDRGRFERAGTQLVVPAGRVAWQTPGASTKKSTSPCSRPTTLSAWRRAAGRR